MYVIVAFHDDSFGIVPSSLLYDTVHAGKKWECRTFSQAERFVLDYCEYVVIENKDNIAVPLKSSNIQKYSIPRLIKGFRTLEKATQFAEKYNKTKMKA